ncbi:hypothetical protein GE061_017368 [Apolygus lucorum]|uniref:Peptidase S1 domain-containing protein n=1 Tax=Apolygus lucorum TaxID=248454 RepID=A0A8S9XAZ9_APOLU|nr:hypothetical protein GE061_017368 [Apolygus lucorum]
MVDEAPDKDGFRRYLADDAFTDMVLVYHGATKTDNMHKGYTSRLFFIHQRCGYRYDLLIHDYGLIALKADAASRSNPFNFAPVYSEKTLNRLWWKFNAEAPTCLVVGFGRSVSLEQKTKPSVMQHTWKVLQNYERCYNWTFRASPNFNYSINATWSCILQTPGFDSYVHIGDSGSPVTCDNEYFGFISGGSPQSVFPASDKYWNRFKFITIEFHTVSPIVFSPFVNTAEMRAAFVEKIQSQIDDTEELRRLDDCCCCS